MAATERITVYVTKEEQQRIYSKARDAKAESASKWARDVLVRESKPKPPRVAMHSD